MEALSLIALILLSLVGYSAGVSCISKSIPDPKPGIIDLFLVALVWGGAVYAKGTLDINRWLLTLICAVSALLIACIATILKKAYLHDAQNVAQDSEVESLEPPSLWERWKKFSSKMGNFQSRLILSFFYFVIAFPFALIVRIFSDPLKLKFKRTESHWLTKKTVGSVQDNFRKQF